MMRPIWLVLTLMIGASMAIGFLLGLIGSDNLDTDAVWPQVISAGCGLFILMGFLTIRQYVEKATMLQEEWNRIHNANIKL